MQRARRRLEGVSSHVHTVPSSTAAASAPAPPAPHVHALRVVVCGFTQEVASMNPRPSTIADFTRHWGGAVHLPADAEAVFAGWPGAKPVELVRTYSAGGPSAGVLEQASFEMMAEELVTAVRAAAAAGPVDGVYFAQHGAMAAAEESDPEGYLLEAVRAVVGASVPIVITLDLHGVVTPVSSHQH